MRDCQLLLTQSKKLMAAARIVLADSRDLTARARTLMANTRALQPQTEDAAEARDAERPSVDRQG